MRHSFPCSGAAPAPTRFPLCDGELACRPREADDVARQAERHFSLPCRRVVEDQDVPLVGGSPKRRVEQWCRLAEEAMLIPTRSSCRIWCGEGAGNPGGGAAVPAWTAAITTTHDDGDATRPSPPRFFLANVNT